MASPSSRRLDGLLARSGEFAELYCDGACLGNPGRGGYGVVLRHRGREIILSGGFRNTTNNRMELMAAIVGLTALEFSSAVRLVTDSQYLSNGINKQWAMTWRRNGWRRGTRAVPNADLWAELLKLYERHDVVVEWVRGHSGHIENERCDRLARAAATADTLKIDVGYESLVAQPVLF